MSGIDRPRNLSKARVSVAERGATAVVIKDFSAAPLWYRWIYARRTLQREARAYERLAGLAGIPRCLGFDDPDAIVLERVPGEPLDRWSRDAVPAVALDALDRLVAAVHARGVAIADLHRSNVLVDEAGGVHLVDFALALVARDPARPGPLVRRAMQLDRHAAARIRAYTLRLPEPRAEGWFGTVYRWGRWLKRRA